MKPTKTGLVILLAAALLVGAAGAVLATPGGPSAPAAQVPAAASPTPEPGSSTGPKVKVGQQDDVLTGVLDDLVAKGTISKAQKQAILDGITTERTARQEARKAAREQAKADRQQLRDFLADGVITQQEFDKLPAASSLRTLATLMDDGKITTDELKALGRGWTGINGGHGWWAPGKGGWGNGWPRAKNPSPSASPSTGG